MTMQPIPDDMVTMSKICRCGQVRMGPKIYLNLEFFSEILKKLIQTDLNNQPLNLQWNDLFFRPHGNLIFHAKDFCTI